MSDTKKIKPLGERAYGSIGHLPNSRLGTGDHCITGGQTVICTTKARDKHDIIIVQEKLDGSCVSIARIGTNLVPLIRAGYLARDSVYLQHVMFADWVESVRDRLDFLNDGERLCGEWLAQAHGTRYQIRGDPFVAFDIVRKGHDRATWAEFSQRVGERFKTPFILGQNPMTTDEAIRRLGEFGHHDALDPVEGAVWRVERKGKVDFLAKWVRPDKTDGRYLEALTGAGPVWNWRPER